MYLALQALLKVAVPLGDHSGFRYQFHEADKFLLDTVVDCTPHFGNKSKSSSESLPMADANADLDAELLKEKNVKAYSRRGTSRESFLQYKEAAEDFKSALLLEPQNKVASV